MATTKLLSGSWHVQHDGKTRVHTWSVGQQVTVQPRTWPGMNRPGGHGRITKLHYGGDGQVESIDVKYTLSGSDKRLEPYLVEPFHDDEDRPHRRGGRGAAAGGSGAAAPSNPNKEDILGVNTTMASAGKGLIFAAGATDEKENAVHPQRSFPRRRQQHQQPPPQQVRGRRPSIKPLAASLKTPKKKAPSQAAKPSPSSASGSAAPSVPLLIYADDERSVVSELETHTGAEEPPRSSYLTDSSAGSGPRRCPAASASANRGRLQSLETNDAASEFSRRSSPCSNAKSIVSGQLSVVGRRRGGGGAGGTIPSPASYRKVEKRLLVTSPSTTKCLAVGQVSSSPRADKAEEAAESRDDHKRSPSQSPRKRRPTSATKLYVSQLQPVNELACCDPFFVQGRADRRDDEEEERRESRKAPDVPDGSPPPLDDTMSCSSHCTRRNDFVSHLVDALTDSDGVLDENCVLDAVNRLAAEGSNAAPYDPARLNEYLEYLSDQHKIFRSDGQIYLV